MNVTCTVLILLLVLFHLSNADVVVEVNESDEIIHFYRVDDLENDNSVKRLLLFSRTFSSIEGKETIDIDKSSLTIQIQSNSFPSVQAEEDKSQISLTNYQNMDFIAENMKIIVHPFGMERKLIMSKLKNIESSIDIQGCINYNINQSFLSVCKSYDNADKKYSRDASFCEPQLQSTVTDMTCMALGGYFFILVDELEDFDLVINSAELINLGYTGAGISHYFEETLIFNNVNISFSGVNMPLNFGRIYNLNFTNTNINASYIITSEPRTTQMYDIDFNNVKLFFGDYIILTFESVNITFTDVYFINYINNNDINATIDTAATGYAILDYTSGSDAGSNILKVLFFGPIVIYEYDIDISLPGEYYISNSLTDIVINGITPGEWIINFYGVSLPFDRAISISNADVTFISPFSVTFPFAISQLNLHESSLHIQNILPSFDNDTANFFNSDFEISLDLAVPLTTTTVYELVIENYNFTCIGGLCNAIIRSYNPQITTVPDESFVVVIMENVIVIGFDNFTISNIFELDFDSVDGIVIPGSENGIIINGTRTELTNVNIISSFVNFNETNCDCTIFPIKITDGIFTNSAFTCNFDDQENTNYTCIDVTGAIFNNVNTSINVINSTAPIVVNNNIADFDFKTEDFFSTLTGDVTYNYLFNSCSFDSVILDTNGGNITFNSRNTFKGTNNHFSGENIISIGEIGVEADTTFQAKKIKLEDITLGGTSPTLFLKADEGIEIASSTITNLDAESPTIHFPNDIEITTSKIISDSVQSQAPSSITFSGSSELSPLASQTQSQMTVSVDVLFKMGMHKITGVNFVNPVTCQNCTLDGFGDFGMLNIQGDDQLATFNIRDYTDIATLSLLIDGGALELYFDLTTTSFEAMIGEIDCMNGNCEIVLNAEIVLNKLLQRQTLETPYNLISLSTDFMTPFYQNNGIGNFQIQSGDDFLISNLNENGEYYVEDFKRFGFLFPKPSASVTSSPTPSASPSPSSTPSLTLTPMVSTEFSASFLLSATSTQSISATATESSSISAVGPFSATSTPTATINLEILPPVQQSPEPIQSSTNRITQVRSVTPSASPEFNSLNCLINSAACPNVDPNDYKIPLLAPSGALIFVTETDPNSLIFSDNSDVVSDIFDVSLVNPNARLGGDVEICLKAQTNSKDLCLGYLDESKSPPKWECEDRCLQIDDNDLICGETDHFTNFALLLDGKSGNGRSGCDDFDGWITNSWAGDFILIISCFAFCIVFGFVIVVLGTLIPPTKKFIYGKEGYRIQKTRRASSSATTQVVS